MIVSPCALVGVDLHRGHLDPAVATMPVPADQATALLARTIPAFRAFREVGVPIIHVVTEYRTPEEIRSNPFWVSRQSQSRAKAMEHNLSGSTGPEVMEGLQEKGDYLVSHKKRYSAFLHTGLELLLRSLNVFTVFLAGVNTNSCILATAFEAVNRDFATVVLQDCVDSMDGEEAHRQALHLISICLGQVMTSEDALRDLSAAGVQGAGVPAPR
ncbi:MAG: cysteine hydrolase [SAR324 cluster bacterium]|nr:cysteine hydrolase [SAR324 cluster bacterium]